jgi:hypothetical protein
MPSGFKGTQVHISAVNLGPSGTGPKLTVQVQFCDGDGVVHAITKHELEPSVTPEIEEATKSLLDALKPWVEKIHYDTPDNKTEKVALRGIVESLVGENTHDHDGVGVAG